MGVDVGAAASAAFSGGEPAGGTAGEPAGGEPADEACAVEGEPAVAGAAAAVQGAASGGGAEAAETIDQAQLLGGGGGERSMFRLTASLGTLQVLLNYEGTGAEQLSQVPSPLPRRACCSTRLGFGRSWPCAQPLPLTSPLTTPATAGLCGPLLIWARHQA